MKNPLVTAQFTRPANTTAYASGDLVANDVDSVDVAPMAFNLTGPYNGMMIRRARLVKSTTTTANSAFRLHLWSQDPAQPTGGDNVALAISCLKSYLGYFEFLAADAVAWADGTVQFAVPDVGGEISAPGVVYGLLEAREAYAPGSLEVFHVQLEVVGE